MKNKNKGIEAFLSKHMAEIETVARKVLPVLKEAMEKHGPQGVTEYAHQLIDTINTNTGINDKVSCSAGCHFCCYGEIQMSYNEARVIVSVIEQFQIPVDMELVKRQNKRKHHKLKYADKRCSMLDDKGMCKIYDFRPTICRLYNSMNDPQDCNEKDKEPDVGTLRTIEGFGIAAALMLLDESRGENDFTYNLHEVINAKRITK